MMLRDAGFIVFALSLNRLAGRALRGNQGAVALEVGRHAFAVFLLRGQGYGVGFGEDPLLQVAVQGLTLAALRIKGTCRTSHLPRW